MVNLQAQAIFSSVGWTSLGSGKNIALPGSGYEKNKNATWRWRDKTSYSKKKEIMH